MRYTAKLFGLIGKKLRHTYSPQLYAELFHAIQPVCKYRCFEVDVIQSVRNLSIIFPHLRGLNVTVPYKQSILAYLDACDVEAAQIGAINTIVIHPNDYWVGYNTDVIGFAKSLTEPLHFADAALILGTGGAAQAVKYALLHYIGLAQVDLVSRSPQAGTLTYHDLSQQVVQRYRLIVNATPLGMFPNTSALPNFPFEYLRPQHYVYDLIYNPAETLFLAQAKAQGAKTQNGLKMLQEQALVAWQHWQTNLW